MGRIEKRQPKKPMDSPPRPLRLLTWNIRYDWMNNRDLGAQQVRDYLGD